jgi:hypothetical protein
MSCYPNNSCNRNVLKSCSNTDVVVYTGENLTCTGIEYGDSLTVVLQKLDEKYCEILDIIENCNTTTSTTTNTPTPSSCASPFAKILDILEPFEPVPPTTTTTTTISIDSICVSGAGSSIMNGTYIFDGVVNGKNVYRNGNNYVFWSAGYWAISEIGNNYYTSFDDVLTPELVTTWEVSSFGQGPVPTVTTGNCS